MDRTSLLRLRWKLHGAWMWPTFVVLTLADGLLVKWLPLAGDSESAVAGALIGAVAGLAGIALLAPILGHLLRGLRSDMPKVVARDYAGTGVIVAITAALLAAGLVHHSSVGVDQRALADAVARAEAYIGDRAPAQFRGNLASANAYELQPPQIYRVCVTNLRGNRNYCVVVDRSKPFAASVRTDGSEPNQVLAQGTG
jgi:hypothetical protein